MNIGDKVRLVHGKEEGVVYRFLPGNVVEIEIEDGFRIPVLRNEVVLISPVEQERLLKEEKAGRVAPTPVSGRAKGPFSEKGIYLAFQPVNDREVSLHLINNSDWILPFVAYQDREDKQLGLASGVLEPRTSRKLTDLLMKDFEQWPTFDIQALYFREGSGAINLPFQKRLKCRAQSFYKRKQKAPVLDKEGYVYQLDEEGHVTPTAESTGISAAALRERMLSPQGVATELPIARPASVVDLHLEKLTTTPGKLSNADKLSLQINTFEQQLEQAIASGLDEITFIHGAGNGVLRTELHRRLSKNQHVQFFKDAQKEKFGYGATQVKIR
jgi:hypothetical protein